MPPKRKKYDREFREGAVRIVEETGKPIAVTRCVLPVPGGPRRTRLRASVRNAPEARAAIWLRMAGWASKSKSSSVLVAGNPAARIRCRAPEALRAETSRSRTAAR